MNLDEFYKSVGGKVIVQGDGAPAYNFGLVPRDPTNPADLGVSFAKASGQGGKWDGRPVNLMQAEKLAFGDFLPAHFQRRGMCGGHAGSKTGELLQAIKIASGLAPKSSYRPISHGWMYAKARERSRILSKEDGVLGGTIPPTMAEAGNLTLFESGEDKLTPAKIDEIAFDWGYRGAPKTLAETAADNIVKSYAQVGSFEEACDAIYNGSVICISDSQGFSMTRDSRGICRPQGTWYHYHVFAGIWVIGNQMGLVYVQSWGPNTPDGPLLEGYPAWCFGVDPQTSDRMIRNGEAHAVSMMDDWAPAPIAWSF